MSEGTIQTRLAAFLREQAAWRARKATEYPDDRRNAASAEALTGLAEYVEALPAEDPNLLVLDSLQEPFALDGVFVAGEKSSPLVSRFGFDHAPPPSDSGNAKFLTELAAALVTDEETDDEGGD